MNTCVDITHGITWKDSSRGPGDFCRRCGRAVEAADLAPREAWQRLADAIPALRRDVLPRFPGIDRALLDLEALQRAIAERRGVEWKA